METAVRLLLAALAAWLSYVLGPVLDRVIGLPVEAAVARWIGL